MNRQQRRAQERLARKQKDAQGMSPGVPWMIQQGTAEGFISKPIPNGGTWTLTQFVFQFLERAEKIAGKRNRDWTFVGIEFFGRESAGAVPTTWYPGYSEFIAIRLTEDVAHDVKRASYQLAHEVGHLISPTVPPPALNIEEGFATWLQEDVCKSFLGVSYPMSPAYKQPYDDVCNLLAADPEAIKKARDEEREFVKFTPLLLKKVVPSLDDAIATRLCQRWKP